ncbi:PRC-barrel domain containing protein [Aquicoccus sp. SCR17]|nr:PRC-barrel domain containing protein [Carideicomes alvinocaridis]
MAEDSEMSDDNAMASSGMNGRSDISGMTSADMGGMQGNLIRTRDITGGDVYTTNEANDEGWNSANVYDGVGDNWNQIGEIEDIVLTQDGQMAGIIAEVGGFLDIADKHVMVAVNDVSLVAVDNAEYAFVTRLNEEDLESMEGVDEGFWD